ncbi:PAAR domain-containing protein [Herbaspirillum rhizosphaerae]|uniref:PAAR domain-containing protein n=1 Tax=Herbaspirillum rhizosphaerae TaxID=346179 RepID=A0ABW8ZEM1_9BURK
MRRFYIFEGDKTSSGGTPIASQDHSTWHGRKYIMLNDKVYCPACKKTGTVVGQGARLNDNWMGKRPALNDDICVCGCRPAPKLIAYQDNDWQMMTVEEMAAQGFGTVQDAATPAAEMREHSVQFILRSKKGRPLTNYPYVMESADGHRLEGFTDKDGKTERA